MSESATHDKKTHREEAQADLFQRTANQERNGIKVNIHSQHLDILNRVHRAAVGAYGDVSVAQTARFLTALGWSVLDSSDSAAPNPPAANSPAPQKKTKRTTQEEKQAEDLVATCEALRGLLAHKGNSYITHVRDPALRRLIGDRMSSKELAYHLSYLARENGMEGVSIKQIGLVPTDHDTRGCMGYCVSKT